MSVRPLEFGAVLAGCVPGRLMQRESPANWPTPRASAGSDRQVTIFYGNAFALMNAIHGCQFPTVYGYT